MGSAASPEAGAVPAIASAITNDLKRAVQTVDHQKTKGLFQPFVTVGHVTADLPFSIQARGDAFFLTTSIGHAFQIFNMQTMKVLFVSPPLPGKITALTAHRDLTYVAVGGAIHVHHRSKPVERITLPATPGNVAVSAASLEAGIIQLLIFGDYLLALSAPHNALMIFSRSTRQFLNRIDFPDTFTPVKMLHPSTYVNKILIASAQGSMVLYNLHTLMLLYTFNSLRSPITTLAQSPILDVVAIGTLDGRIVLHDLKRDEVVFMLSQAGPVMALSFKNVEPNNLMTSPLLASATNDGTVFIWNLNTRRLAHTMQAAHDASIPSMQFLNGQPLLITGGADNAIKTWLFDQPDRPRLLRQRSGHARPPTRVHFYPSDNHVVLSAGQDGALRSSHMVRENANREFSQKPLMGFARRANQAKSGGKAHDRIQPVTAWDMNPLRDRDFDSIVTAHNDTSIAYSWNYGRGIVGKLRLESTDGTPFSAVCVSACGHFVTLGTKGGALNRFNMQSGMLRASVALGATVQITAVVSDAENAWVYVATNEAKLYVFKWAQLELHTVLDLEAPFIKMVYHAESQLLAGAAQDMAVVVLDVASHRRVREFVGHTHQIIDLAFSPDGRWLVSAGLDGRVCTWDLPSTYLIDAFRPTSLVTSVAWSPNGDYLAATHAGELGIATYANRALYAAFTVRPIDIETETRDGIALPAVAAVDASAPKDAHVDQTLAELTAEAGDAPTAADAAALHIVTPDGLTDQLIETSTLSRSHWLNLVHLEDIKARNKAKEAPKEPEKAPFFLPTVAGTAVRFD
ncbi:hypothetical protein CXG81DRAFT_11309, partial [Caulochytrium protostelioides]